MNDAVVCRIASLGASSLSQHPLFRPGVLPGSPFLGPLHAGMFPWPTQPHPLHAVLQQSLDHHHNDSNHSSQVQSHSLGGSTETIQ